MAERDADRGGAREALLLFGCFVAIGLALYDPIMETGWLSDDVSIIAENPYVQELSLANLQVILDPYGPAIAYAFNYSPVHLLLHAVDLQLFGTSFWGHHFVNVLLHSITALLLIALLRSSKLPWALAVSAGFLFFLHPANAEPVALIFEAKTTLSTALALGAMLCFFRWPLAGVMLFGLALLTKLTAAFALPGVGLLLWARSSDEARRTPSWGWVAAWALVLILVSIPELAAFRRTGQAGAGMGDTALELGRSIVSIAAHYLVMATTSLGVSVHHNPEPTKTWLDPWFLGGVVALAALGFRAALCFARRKEEAAYWGLAVAAFFPVSQLFPFLYPIADRYLYTMLIGLLGGACLALRELPRVWQAPAWAQNLPLLGTPGGMVAGVLLIVAVGFGFVSSARMGVFRSEEAMIREAAENYPTGVAANLKALNRAGRMRDGRAAAKAIRDLDALGFAAFNGIVSNPVLAPIGKDPEVRSAIRDMAGYWIERLEPIEDPYQIELRQLAYTHLIRDEPEACARVAQRGLDRGGPHDADLRAIRDAALQELARREQAESSSG